MSEQELIMEALHKMNEAFDALQALKRLWGDRRDESTRHLQITITDLEKVLAIYYVYLIAGRQAQDV